MFNRSNIGKFFTIKEISEGTPCKNCFFCVKLRLLEMGFNLEDKFQIGDYMLGLWKINIFSENGKMISSIALRDEEMEKVCVL
jgi:hypothetical protein